MSEALDAIPVVTEEDVPHHDGGRCSPACGRASAACAPGLRSRGLDFIPLPRWGVLVPFGSS